MCSRNQMVYPTKPKPRSVERRPSCQPAMAIDEPLGGPVKNSRPAPGGLADSANDFEITETESILFALAQAVEQRDHQTAGHCERLAFISAAMGTALGVGRAT